MLPRSFAAAVLAGGLAIVPLAAGSAHAAPGDRSIDDAKARCLTGIDNRLTKLDRLDARIANAKRLTDAHEGELTSTHADAREGLTGLRSEVEADEDGASLREDCRSVVVDYRIFALRAPQAHLVIAADAETAAAARLEALEPKLDDAIDKAEADGVDVTEARAALDDLSNNVDEAEALLDGLADEVLAFEPADFNADHDLLQPARTDVRTAAGDLREAAQDAKRIVRMLKDAS